MDYNEVGSRLHESELRLKAWQAQVIENKLHYNSVSIECRRSLDAFVSVFKRTEWPAGARDLLK